MSARARARLTRLGRLAGTAGGVCLASLPVTVFLAGRLTPLAWAKLGVGAVLAAAGLWARPPAASRREGARAWALALTGAGGGLAVVVLAVAANLAAFAHPLEVDLTRERLYTLSPQTDAVLAGLGERGQAVEILAYYAGTEPQAGAAEALLARYRAGSPQVRARVVSPQARPDWAERDGITAQGPRLVVRGGGREARAREPAEQDVTAAIVHVAERAPAQVRVLTGHGEADIAEREAPEGAGQLGDAIVADGYALQPLDLAAAPAAAAGARVALAPPAPATRAAPSGPGLAVPADAALLLVLAPRRALTPPEVAAIDAYLAEGGRALLLLEPHREVGLGGLAARWGIAVQDDVVVDTNPMARLMGLGPAAPIGHLAAVDHPVAAGLHAPMVLDTARSLAPAAAAVALPGIEALPLIQAGQSAWGETHLGADGVAARDAADHPPPLALAMAAQRDAAAGPRTRSEQGRLVVVGDVDWASNRYLGMQGNRDFALAAVAWAADRPERITIRPPHRPGVQLVLTGAQQARLKLWSMDLVPLSLAALGAVVVRRRRLR